MKNKIMTAYNVGYDDAKCNHINDAENYANQFEYMNETKKQTAVDFLIEEITNSTISARKAIEIAKAMEKEQIIQAFKSGLASPYHQDYTLVTQENQEETKSGQYYNETYGL